MGKTPNWRDVKFRSKKKKKKREIQKRLKKTNNKFKRIPKFLHSLLISSFFPSVYWVVLQKIHNELIHL